MSEHILPEHGLPYASPDRDTDGREYVTCPACGQRCYASPIGTGGPVAAYGEHFLAESRQEAGDPFAGTANEALARHEEGGTR